MLQSNGRGQKTWLSPRKGLGNSRNINTLLDFCKLSLKIKEVSYSSWDEQNEKG